MWKIVDIFEADYGCEERQPGEKLKVMVKLSDENGNEKTVSAYDEYLTWNKLDVGSEWPPEPSEEKRKLFFRQKKMLDTFLSTGAVSKEQYDTGIDGLIIKMGFDYDILKEEKD